MKRLSRNKEVEVKEKLPQKNLTTKEANDIPAGYVSAKEAECFFAKLLNEKIGTCIPV